jgi:ferric-dicitrate binding protein FerR (iron transport regulator)
MNANEPLPPDSTDEDAAGQLLRLVGPRPSAPGPRAARVHAAVHERWQAGNRRRTSRRRVLVGSVVLAAAATLVLVVGRVILERRGMAPGDQVAVVEQIHGAPRRIADVPNGGGNDGNLSPNDSVRTGEWLETDSRARLALRFADGTSVRLDVGSRARPLSSSVIELTSGAVYIDTDRESGHFEVRTPVATARDVGTQFEIRLLDLTLRLRVRTGVVELRDGARSVSGRVGTEVVFSATGAVSRPIAAHGSDWDWTASVSPPFEIEGATLSTFLDRVAREHGWTLRYADSALAREASGIILHGSVTGLTPREAIEVTLTASGLTHRLDDGVVIVRRSGTK